PFVSFFFLQAEDGRRDDLVTGVQTCALPISISTRPRSSALTPLSRYSGSTPRRAASHSTVSAVGRVLPRSIWLRYSFEKRPPARSLWVSPAAARRLRRRSPSGTVRGRRRVVCEASLDPIVPLGRVSE